MATINLQTDATSTTALPRAPGEDAADPDVLTITHWRHEDAEFTVGGSDTAWLVLILSEGQRAGRESSGTWCNGVARPGLVTVTNPDEVARFVILGQANVARLLVPMANLAEAAGLNRRPIVKARFIEQEPELERCAQRALVALHEGDGADPLLLSSIVAGLSEAMIEQPFRGSNRAVGGLSRRQLRRVKELIDSRLSAPIASSPSLRELAGEADLSLHHFAREFRRTMGATPYAYMLRRRLDRARQFVIRSPLPLAQVGRLSGFPSASHFADRFHREMGITPSALRCAAQA